MVPTDMQPDSNAGENRSSPRDLKYGIFKSQIWMVGFFL